MGNPLNVDLKHVKKHGNGKGKPVITTKSVEQRKIENLPSGHSIAVALAMGILMGVGLWEVNILPVLKTFNGQRIVNFDWQNEGETEKIMFPIH